jgi:Leucine-rich repeat (LRR) protein
MNRDQQIKIFLSQLVPERNPRGMTHRNIDTFTQIDISGTKIGFIPDLPNLEVLICESCPNLEMVSGNFDKLRYLRCVGCEKLRYISPDLKALTKLEIINAPLISMIPETLIKLVDLRVSYCPLVDNIPDSLINLKFLNCDNTSITNIPNTLEKLKNLSCENCPLHCPFYILEQNQSPRIRSYDFYRRVAFGNTSLII